MNQLKFIIPFLFGLIIYRILGFELNFYTIIINFGLAYVLAPKFKIIQKQHGEEEQMKWLFFKKLINKKL
ncbi:hypothetical protein [Polaribacter sp.]|uniref:hypothetical protein n=1 Tax=Polaribacter sp. TaxID=1920175 RepID=UPI0025DB1BCB|nr:hypothetical protein [Polaribacter sp.]